MASETIVVTGAAGFIGRWVVRDLLERGKTVVGIDDFSNGARENIDEFEDDEQFTVHRVDVRDADDVASLFDSAVDSCIHLAAEIDVQESLDDPTSHFETNVVGTRNVLEACRQHEVRVTQVGTCMVYDAADGSTRISEDHPVKPASPYAGSKLAAENLAESYYHGYDLPVTVLRPFNTYGPYQMTSGSGGVVSIFVDRDLRGEPLLVFGDGTQTRDLLYVTDCAEFITEATFSKDCIGEVLNAGTGTDVSINELARLVASEQTAIEHVEHHHPQSEVETLRCDPDKAEQLLGWEPSVSLEGGIAEVRKWLSTSNGQ